MKKKKVCDKEMRNVHIAVIRTINEYKDKRTEEGLSMLQSIGFFLP